MKAISHMAFFIDGGKMKLNEVLRKIETNIPFTSMGPRKYDYDSYAIAQYKFVVNGSNITVRFFVNKQLPSKAYYDHFVRRFKEYGQDIDVLAKQMVQLGGSYEVEFARDGDYSVTGGGDVIPIMSTVTKIIETFLHSHKVAELMFTAHEKSRIKFYDRLVKEISPKLGLHSYKTNDSTFYMANLN